MSRKNQAPQAKRIVRISACMIVRDEAQNIGRSIASLLPVADEVIVVDTGSTDDTAAVAADMGAEVFSYEWRDDFAAARNESLRHASGDWILYLDADEQLHEATPGALRSLCGQLTKTALGGCLIVRSASDSEGITETVAEQCRLFRNGRGIHFDGRVHEQLRTNDGKPLAPAAAPEQAWIEHSGYIPAGDLMERKGERNRRLLEVAIAEQPDEPAHYFNLGRQLVWESDHVAALPALEKAIALWRTSGQRRGGWPKRWPP